MGIETIDLSRSESRRFALCVELLVARHGTQKGAAAALGIAHGSVFALLQARVGRRSRPTLEAVASAFGCSVDCIARGSSAKATLKPIAEVELARVARERFHREGGPLDAPEQERWAVFARHVAAERGTPEERAVGGYAESALAAGGRAPDGQRLPLWGELDSPTQRRWTAAGLAVAEASFLGVQGSIA